MRAALERVRLDKVGTTAVSESAGIPTRTLRRYVNYSKNPSSLFYIEEPEEEECNDDVIISWKPQTTVPMFKILDTANVDASIHGGDDLTVDAAFSASPCNDDVVPIVPDDVFHFDAPLSGADIDNTDFDDLFKDFVNDEMFADLA